MGEVGPDWFAVYLIPETLRATGLGAKREGATVNLEIEAQTQVHARSLTVQGSAPDISAHHPGVMHSRRRWM